MTFRAAIASVVRRNPRLLTIIATVAFNAAMKAWPGLDEHIAVDTWLMVVDARVRGSLGVHHGISRRKARKARPKPAP